MTETQQQPSQGHGDLKATLDQLTERLHEHRAQTERDGHANPIRLMADSLFADIQSGRLGTDELDALVQNLSARAFSHRAARLKNYLGEFDVATNLATIEAILREQAQGPDGVTRPFVEFERVVSRRLYGIVLTAHPTFSLARELQEDLVSLVLEEDQHGQTLDGPTRQTIEARIAARHHRPEQLIDLNEEHRQSLTAIQQLRSAMAAIYGVVFDVTNDHYPDHVRDLIPCLINIATWVGYDTDGRADISWATTFAKRIITQQNQLDYYLERTIKVRARLDDRHPLAAHLELIQARLALTAKALADEIAVFGAFQTGDRESEKAVAAIGRTMAQSNSQRLVDGRQLGKLVDRALELAEDADSRRDLWVMRAEVANNGLTAARTHLRINATQLHNSIRKTIAMNHAADDPSYQRSYVAAITELINEVEPAKINFGSLVNERATAKRSFMIMQQMLTYLDGSEPIRFLIAECETPLTLLAALYFAKLFGVDDRVDISPLFETSTAIERGTELLRGAIQVPAYKAYLKGRGRLCIQTGFSDAGRYIGQISASAAIERIRIGLRDLLTEEGLSDLELIIFDTHGESIGRGAHPRGLLDRFRYYDTPYTRQRFKAAGIAITEESSFQGGDGYLHFLRMPTALAVTTRVLEHLFEPTDPTDDPFYDDTAYVPEFFAAIRTFNYRIIANPDYAKLLGAFGLNLLYPTGSRALKRQHDRGIGSIDLDHPSQLRAIPHNSILQQLGILANTIGGVGQAVDKDPDRFQELYRESHRFRRLMMMVEYAFKFTDLDVVRAYLCVFDHTTWLREAHLAKPSTGEEELRLVAGFVNAMNMHDELNRVFGVFFADYIELAKALREHRHQTRHDGGELIVIDPDVRDNLHLLHALRIALIKALMRRAVHIPDFSDRHSTTHRELVSNLMRLDVENALAVLNGVFPLTETSETLDYGDEANYDGGGGQSYRQEHDWIFKPIDTYYGLIRRISTGVVHHIGALG